jgi:hypothetical protein
MHRIPFRNRIWIVLLCLGYGSSFVLSQGSILERRLSLTTGSLSPEVLLCLIEQELDFRFAYNADILPPHTISLSVQDEPLGKALRDAFGKAYLFRNNGHIVIILKKETGEEKRKQSIEIRGFVREGGSERPLASATVYDMASRRSGLSDSEGAFILNLPVTTRRLALRCSKQGYRDSIVVVDPSQTSPPLFKLYALRKEVSHLEPLPGQLIAPQGSTHNMLIRRLVSTASFLNSRNVRIFDQQPVQLSLIPGIGTNYRLSGAIVNHFSLNLFSGYSAGVNGFEAGGIMNMNQFDVYGVQIGGVANLTGEKVQGFQAAGLFNRTGKKVLGVQLSGGLNTGSDTVRGVQIAGLMNRRPVFVQGMQVAGIANVCQGAVKGVQMAGLYNYSASASFQMGLINVCDSAGGAPLGLVNIIRGGYYALSLATDAGQHHQLHFVMGSPKLYSMLGLTLFNLFPEQRAGLSYGLGRTWFPGWRIEMHTELVASVIPPTGSFDRHTLSLLSFSPQLSMEIVKHRIRLMAGPSYHLLLSAEDNAFSAHFSDHLPGNVSFNRVPRQTRFLGWPSFRVSLRYPLSRVKP